MKPWEKAGNLLAFAREWLYPASIFNLPLLPFLVVITSAPLAAWIPYKAVAAPPFRIVRLSISSGLMSTALLAVGTLTAYPLPCSELLSMGTPSTTYSGWLFPVREL